MLFSIFDDVGDLICCTKQEVDEDGNPVPAGATDLARKLGLGSALFLMSTKSVAYLFLFISIINIPVMAFFYSGAGTGSTNIFAMLSLGNVGSPAMVCDDMPDLRGLYN